MKFGVILDDAIREFSNLYADKLGWELDTEMIRGLMLEKVEPIVSDDTMESDIFALCTMILAEIILEWDIEKSECVYIERSRDEVGKVIDKQINDVVSNECIWTTYVGGKLYRVDDIWHGMPDVLRSVYEWSYAIRDRAREAYCCEYKEDSEHTDVKVWLESIENAGPILEKLNYTYLSKGAIMEKYVEELSESTLDAATILEGERSVISFRLAEYVQDMVMMGL